MTPDLDLEGLTLAERILSMRVGRRVQAGELVVAEVDQVMMVDSIAPTVIDLIEEELDAVVRHPEKISIVIDHVSPAANVEVATTQKRIREYARRRNLRVFDVGRGICHQVLIEEGLARPGWLVVGSDSHSTTYGGVAAFGTGMGATDVALAAASGRTWLRVPATIRVLLRGERPAGVSVKDVALEVVGRLTADGATYASIEYHGAEALTLAERLTLANLAVEAGAKVGLVPPSGEVAKRYQAPPWLRIDSEAEYSKTLELNLAELSPRLAVPAAVDNVQPAAAYLGLRVDQVFLGTCTNGRLEDLHVAAAILRGRRIAEGTRMLVIPASSQVLAAAVADGTMSILLEAGVVLGTPGCGPCMGRHMGVLAPGEICVSTSNRNFVGRMGSPEARVFLASPAVAAASALGGVISLPQEPAKGEWPGSDHA